MRKIQTFSSYIFDRDYEALSASGKEYFKRLNKSVLRMQALITDLLTYSKVSSYDQVFADVDLNTIIEEVKQEYIEDLNNKHVKFDIGEMCNLFAIPFQVRQIFHNLISNSIKFSRPDVSPAIKFQAALKKAIAV